MAVDPCCGNPLQTGAKLIAIISLLCTLVLIICELALLYSNGLSGVEVLNPEFAGERAVDTNSKNVTSILGVAQKDQQKMIYSVPFIDVVISFCWIGSWILDIVFSIILFQGARTKNRTLCLIWFYFRCAALVFRVVFLIIYVLAGYSVVTKIPVIALCIFRVYSLWVVNEFIKLIEQEKHIRSTIPSVVISFEDGSKSQSPQIQRKDEGHENPMYKG